jgi:hypothetical protein
MMGADAVTNGADHVRADARGSLQPRDGQRELPTRGRATRLLECAASPAAGAAALSIA